MQQQKLAQEKPIYEQTQYGIKSTLQKNVDHVLIFGNKQVYSYRDQKKPQHPSEEENSLESIKNNTHKNIKYAHYTH